MRSLIQSICTVKVTHADYDTAFLYRALATIRLLSQEAQV